MKAKEAEGLRDTSPKLQRGSRRMAHNPVSRSGVAFAVVTQGLQGCVNFGAVHDPLCHSQTVSADTAADYDDLLLNFKATTRPAVHYEQHDSFRQSVRLVSRFHT